MSARALERLAQRKALLTARAELERMQLSLAIQELRERIDTVPRPRTRGARPGLLAATLVGVGLPLLGRTRLTNALRGVSIALSAWRLVRNWRRPER